MKFRIVFTSIFLLIFTVACFAADQGTIFIIRHAEKLSTAPDALLSAAGHKRANCLAHLLGELRKRARQRSFASVGKNLDDPAVGLQSEPHHAAVGLRDSL